MGSAGFINRVDEMRVLGQVADGVAGRHTFLFLCAPSGYGKSALVDELIRRWSHALAVRVPILRRRGTGGLDYVRQVARAIDRFATRTARFERLQAFVGRDWSSRAGADLLSRSLGDALRYAPGASALAPGVQKIVGADGLAAAAGLLQETLSSQAALQGYLKAYFGVGGSLLSIENVQGIDDRSMGMIENLVREADPGFWILEHTEAVDGHDVEVLMDWACRAGAHVERLDIASLPFDDLSSALGIAGEVRNIMRNQYARSKGNLHEFLATKRHLEDRKGTLGDDELAATRRAIRDLPPASMMVFALIAMHDGEVAKELLGRAIRSTPQLREHVEGFLLDEALALFERCALATPRGDDVRVVHDSVLKAFFGPDEAVPYAIIASRVWLSLYKEVLCAGDVFIAKADALSAVMFYALQLDDEVGLEDALRQLTAGGVVAASPRRVEACVDRLFRRADATGKEASPRLHGLALKIMAPLVRAGASASAQKLLPRLLPGSPAARFYDAALAIEGDRSQEALKKCRALLFEERHYRAGNLWKAANLLLLAALRMTNQPEEGARLFLDLEGGGDFRDSSLEPHFMLLAGAALPAASAVDRVGLAIARFAERGDRHAENCARVTLSQCLADLGKLAAAREALDGIVEDASSPGETFSISNNKAVLLMRGGTAHAEAVALLREAALTASDRFSLLIVYVNLMVANALVGESGRAHEAARTVERLLRDEEPQEFEIRRIALYDLAWFYGQRGMTDHAAAMHEAAGKVPSRINQPLWDYRFGRRAEVARGDASRAALPYDLPMFAYWSLDVVSHLGS